MEGHSKSGLEAHVITFSKTRCSGSHKSWIMDPRKAINTQKNRPEHQYITKQTNRQKTEDRNMILFYFWSSADRISTYSSS